MKVMLAGSLVEAGEAKVSVFDRGFLYGDGLFETVRVYRGHPFRWDDHMDRLELGLNALDLATPYTREQLRAQVIQLLDSNQLQNATLRLTVSRGPGPRGYSPRNAGPPTVVITSEAAPALEDLSPAPAHLITSRFRLPARSPLGAWKTANRLLNVLARAEVDAACADEALMLNDLGHLAEATSANLFWFEPEGCTLATPGLEQGVLDGITRRLALRFATELGWNVRLAADPPQVLRVASGAFLSLSSRGFVEIASLDHRALPRHPGVELLRSRYRRMVLDAISG